ncbi:MAG: peptide MFS transporter [Chitinophagales bacterium]|nr:peptide MFS transporter [Chitinophagales bacterium]HAE36082.1 MFS transporter [Bacteroidota bacterium]MCB9018765.1 peptide MFS transporter [Chitinophagales bacterium]MCB9020943.1 peptide MFS transporter [Chitinophagales bacterium]MCB9031850.1 peptide MFS transporter [Chitinophagales bacterium]
MSHHQTLEEIQDFKGKYPRQIWYLFFSEMWERFSFYGMRGMLTYFMINQLLMEDKTANLQYGATQAFVYAFTFIGGLFADKILGFRKSLFWGGLLMITGSIILAVDPHQFFFLGISFNIIGTGFFKPNISTMVGALYKDGDARRDAGFSLFYSGINIGALLGGYFCISIGKGTMLTSMVPEGATWNVAFGLVAVVMTISLLTFVYTRNTMATIGLSPLRDASKPGNSIQASKRWYEYAVYAGGLISIPIIMKMVANPVYVDWFMYIVGPAALLWLFYEMTKHSGAEVRRLFAALLFIVFSVIFWAIFEQAGGSLTIFAANNLDNELLGFIKLDPNGVNNAANSLFVIFFAPVIGLIWIALAKKKKEPNTIVKFGLGFLFLGLAFYIFFGTRFFATMEGIASLDVFTLAYFVVTLGELCLSPIGLSAMTKLSPARLQGLMMGMWFLASAYGQYVAGLFGASIAGDVTTASNYDKLMIYTQGYKDMAIYAVIAGVILIIVAPFVRKRLMGHVH